MNTIHKTNGIVIKTIKYGDTSIIATIYTELFGMQSYIVKGIRKPSKKGSNAVNYFYPSTILGLSVYHNELKNLQFIKDYQLNYLHKNIFSDIVKHAVIMYCIELLQHCIKEPESNPDLFYFLEEQIKFIDKAEHRTAVANFPLFFSLKLADLLGFGIMNNYSNTKSILDLQQGIFINDLPLNVIYLEQNLAEISSLFLNINNAEEIQHFQLNQSTRRQLIDAYIQYFALHVNYFTKMQSIEVLREVL